jgi:hypothetical protein
MPGGVHEALEFLSENKNKGTKEQTNGSTRS